jgi:DNA-binding response OmpR family regulator
MMAIAPPRVLIVEDEWMIASVMEQILTEAGMMVSGKSACVETALQLIYDLPLDIVILDANLDGVSTEPVAQVLHARQTPYLIVSGYGREQISGSLLKAPFLGKPFSPNDLLTKVRSLSA